MNSKQLLAVLAIALSISGAFLCSTAAETDATGEDPAPVEPVYLAQIVGGESYETLADAILSAEAGSTIRLLADQEVAATIALNKNLTLDLNGHTLSGRDVRVFHLTNGSVTISGNGEIRNYHVTNLSNTNSVIRVGDNSGDDRTVTLTINEGVTISSDCCYAVSVFGSKTVENVHIYGTLISADATVSTLGTDSTRSSIYIYPGAEVRSTGNIGIYMPSGYIVMTGGLVSGKTGIYFKAQTLEISGGKVIGNGPALAALEQWNGGDPTGDAVVIQNMNYPQAANGFSVTISNAVDLESTYAHEVGYYEGSQTSVGTISIPKTTDVYGAEIMVGNHLFVNFDEAFVIDNEEVTMPYGTTIVLMSDLELDVDMEIAALSFNIDMNGHAINSENGSVVKLKQSADITILGNSVSEMGVPILLLDATMVLNGGQYKGTIESAGTATIIDGLFTQQINQTSGAMIIENGTFKAAITSVGGTLTLKGGIFDGSVVMPVVSGINKLVTLKNGASMTFGGLTIVSTGVTTTSNGLSFDINDATLNGTVAANQALNVKGICQTDSLTITKNGKLTIDRDAIFTVNTAFTADKTQSDLSINGKVVVKGNVVFNAMASLGNDVAILDGVSGYGSGFTINKGSVILAGDTNQGTITVIGVMKIEQNVNLSSTQIVVSPNSTLEVAAGKTVSGGTIVNKGTVNVYGTVTSAVNNAEGKVLKYNGGSVTGQVTGNDVTTVAIKIVEFTVPEIKVGQTLLIPIDTIPPEATLYLQGNSWFKVNNHELVGVPEKVGTYNFTLTASIIENGTTYTDSYDFTVNVVADPDAQDEDKNDSGISIKMIFLAALIIIFLLVIVLTRVL